MSRESQLGILGHEYDPKFLRRALVVTGLAYPIWHLAAPDGARDPAVVWWAIGATDIGVALLATRSALVAKHLQKLFYACSWLVTLHFFTLAFVNDMYPFYAIGSDVAVVAVAGTTRERSALVAYGTFVLGTALVYTLLGTDLDREMVWAPLPIVLGFYYYWIGIHEAAAAVVRRDQEELERRVEQRTRELSEANAELRRGIQERALLEEQLRFSQKMEAIGRLAGGVAHDFNNMLTAIRGYCDLAKEQIPEGHMAQEDLQQIELASERAGSLTRELLTFSREDVPETRVLDLSAVVRQMVPMLRKVMGEDTQVEARLAPTGARVRANPGQLDRVILNLALNARDAMPSGGKLTLDTSIVRRGEVDSEELLAQLAGDDYVLFSVSDTGVGMDALTRSRAFEPFFTTKDVDRGTGMGLATVYGVVKEAGGHVHIDSEPGRGARFALYFPLAGEPVDAPAGGEGSRRRLRGSERILLVEDEDAVRRLTRRILERDGYEILEAADVETALRLAAGVDGPIDLVLSDVVLPRLSGFELARRLAPMLPHARFVFVSGHRNHPSLNGAGLPAGATLLRKPYGPGDLASAVRRALDRSRGELG